MKRRSTIPSRSPVHGLSAAAIAASDGASAAGAGSAPAGAAPGPAAGAGALPVAGGVWPPPHATMIESQAARHAAANGRRNRMLERSRLEARAVDQIGRAHV